MIEGNVWLTLSTYIRYCLSFMVIITLHA